MSAMINKNIFMIIIKPVFDDSNVWIKIPNIWFLGKIRKEHCLVTLTETVLFASSQLLSSRVRCIEIVYGCVAQNVYWIFSF